MCLYFVSKFLLLYLGTLAVPGMESDAWRVVDKRKASKKTSKRSQHIKDNLIRKAQEDYHLNPIGNINDVIKKIQDTM